MDDETFTRTRTSYDSIVEDYERRTSSPPPPVVSFREAFVAGVPRDAWVADLGCGPGRDLAFFRSRALSCLGVDASVGMVQRVHQRGLSAVVGDLRLPPLGSGVCGGIWSSASLLHVRSRDVRSTLAAWHDVLMPSGVLGLTTSLGADEAGWEDVPYAPGTQEHRVPLRRWFEHHDRAANGWCPRRASPSRTRRSR